MDSKIQWNFKTDAGIPVKHRSSDEEITFRFETGKSGMAEVPEVLIRRLLIVCAYNK